MEMISRVISEGMQVIVLIPEIALTYQTVMRFLRAFWKPGFHHQFQIIGGERYDQFERARSGDIDIMIGPRSALFTPFARLGMIIIDEEHEGAYKSEVVPRYQARGGGGETGADAECFRGSRLQRRRPWRHTRRFAVNTVCLN